MNTDLYLTIHRNQERALVRELELRRAAQACAGCVVRASHRVDAVVGRAWRRLVDAARRTAPQQPACCTA